MVVVCFFGGCDEFVCSTNHSRIFPRTQAGSSFAHVSGCNASVEIGHLERERQVGSNVPLPRHPHTQAHQSGLPGYRLGHDIGRLSLRVHVPISWPVADPMVLDTVIGKFDSV